MPRMTETSRQMARKAIRIRITPGAIAYLENNPPFRTLRDVLIAADKQQLPDKTMLSKMKNRSDNVDVSRKVLIMLFLATDGEGSAYQSSPEDGFS